MFFVFFLQWVQLLRQNYLYINIHNVLWQMMIMVAQVFVKCVPTIQPPPPPTQDPTSRQSSMSAVTSRLPRQVALHLAPK